MHLQLDSDWGRSHLIIEVYGKWGCSMEPLESTDRRIITVQALGLWSMSIYPLLKYLLSLEETALACCWALVEI